MDLGKRLKKFIESRNLDQKAFCIEIDFSEQTLSNIINEKTKTPKIDLFISIKKRWPDTDIYYLMSGVPNGTVSKIEDPPVEYNSLYNYQVLVDKVKELDRAVKQIKNILDIKK